MTDSEKRVLDVSASVERVVPEPSGKCPLCGKNTMYDARPFCSFRCANVDLNRWFSESYTLADTPD